MRQLKDKLLLHVLVLCAAAVATHLKMKQKFICKLQTYKILHCKCVYTLIDSYAKICNTMKQKIAWKRKNNSCKL